MKKINFWLFLGLFFIITAINISLIELIPENFKPFPDTLCTRKIYDSYASGENGYIYNNYYNYDENYEYAYKIYLDDSVLNCDELNNIKYIQNITIDIKDGNLEVIDIVKNYQHKLDTVTIRIYNQETFELSPLKEIEELSILEISEVFRDNTENEEIIDYLKSKGCIIIWRDYEEIN